MKIRYDTEADAMYISIIESPIQSTEELDKNTILDFNKEGRLVGIELLFIKERNPQLLTELRKKKVFPA
ncbi:DUF2283 domain-containing protein [Candidatus Woesearchaeota archaeon]|nr:DUF2283 domain-containing protein [Candidatus Woesearchaeota archaeon]